MSRSSKDGREDGPKGEPVALAPQDKLLGVVTAFYGLCLALSIVICPVLIVFSLSVRKTDSAIIFSAAPVVLICTAFFAGRANKCGKRNAGRLILIVPVIFAIGAYLYVSYTGK